MPAPTPKEIREAYTDYRNEWQVTHDEAAIDMRYVAGDPWDPDDRAQREDAGRPCISLDEISPMLDQAINNVRQSKRAIQVLPKGDGANDEDAKKRAALIMAIEERSNAQACYITAFEGAIQRGYGFAVIRTEYKDFESFDQEILIKPILNPDTVLLNPNYRQPDGSDISEAFLLDKILKKDFKHKYPKAEIQDFQGETMSASGMTDWITDKYVTIAEDWRLLHDSSMLFLIETKEGPVVFTEEEWKENKKHGATGTIKRERKIEVPYVMQYLTNGVEILDEVEWAGTRIPIIPCFGKEIWLTEGGVAKRRLLSMVRLARDPQMLLAYLATQECEMAGMIPKTPFVGYKGQFESDAEAWDQLNQSPHAYVQVDPTVDGVTGQVLPIPTRPAWSPEFQEWEIAKDSASRSIQKATGASLLPTQALRQNEKSGVALEKIQTSEQMSIFHFTDNYTRFLHNMGWQINELVTPILDTDQEMPVSEPDGTRKTIRVVGRTSHPVDDDGTYEVQDLQDERGNPIDHIHTAKGKFDVTIGDGPDYESERDEQSQFVDQLITNLPNMPPPGSAAAKILALGIRMRTSLGPIGKQIADFLDPPDPSNLPPQAQAVITQLKSQMQQLQQENAALHMERGGKVLEQQTKLIIEQMKADSATQMNQLNNDIKVLVSLITAKNQRQQQELEMFLEFWKENHGAAHEVGMATMQQQHAQALAQQNAALATQQVTPTPQNLGAPAGAPQTQPQV